MRRKRNRSTETERFRLLKAMAEQFPGYHPILEMARMANYPLTSDALRLAANREVAKYLEPQLRSIELQDLTPVREEKPEPLEIVFVDAPKVRRSLRD